MAEQQEQGATPEGNRALEKSDIELINKGKELAQQLNVWLEELKAQGANLDQRSISLAKTHIENGFMWAAKGIDQPKVLF